MTAIFVLFVMFLGLLFTYRSLRLLIFPPVALVLLALYDYRKLLFATKGLRIKMWAAYFDYFIASGKSFLWGFGPGSFEMIGPTIQIPNPVIPGAQNGPPLYATAWMHNDWLQLLWEYGAIILIVSIAFYIYVLVKSYNSRTIFCMNLGFGACMCFYSPTHFTLGQLLACTLIVESLRKDPQWQRQKRSHQSPRNTSGFPNPVRGIKPMEPRAGKLK